MAFPLLSRWWAAFRAGSAAVAFAAALGACAAPAGTTNRPTGEGYAGVGELVLRVTVPGSRSWYDEFISASPRATVEIRYLGMDDSGRAVFERHDADKLAGAPVSSAARAGTPAAGQIDTRRIVLNLRNSREIRVQGRLIEVLEATPSGVVFRLY